MQDLEKKGLALTSQTLKAYEDDEVWEFKVDNDIHVLSGSQANAVKSAVQSGVKGILWFDTIALNTSFIKSARMVKRGDQKVSDMSKKLAEKFGF